ncbi:MAG: VWA domain-containing protein, partial [Chloroflexi bacterium]|nr:VWA domain-containing protein [Chloroflexota bacterium]
MRYRYTEWDGTQAIPTLDADEILEALSDDLMNFGDLQHALRNLMQRGMRSPDGDRTDGLRDLLQRLRQMRRQRLDQYDMGGVMEDLRRQLEEILRLERETLNDRAGDREGNDAEDGAPQAGMPESGEDGGPSDDGPGDSDDASGGEGGSESGGQRGGSPRAGSQAAGQRGQRGQRGQQSSRGQQGGAGEREQFEEMLRRIAERKQDFLDGLPGDPAGQMKELQNYEFLNPDAQRMFKELTDQLREAMTNQFFQNVQNMVEQMSDGDIQRMKDMTRELNDMLAQRMRGEEPDFDSFMDKYGDMFGD